MNDNRSNPLDDIWPRVRAEIESARRREARRRRVVQIAGRLSGGLLLGIASWILVFGWPGEPAQRRALHPWQLQDISASTGICADYPLARGERLFVIHGTGGHQQHLACVERCRGTVLWQSDLAFSSCRLAADDHRAYLLAATDAGHWFCAAFNAQTGKRLWTEPVPEARATSPSTLAVLPQGLFWTEGGRLVALAPETGRMRWSESVDLSLLSAPVVHRETLYVASQGRLHALDPQTGNRRWSQPLAAGPPLGFSRPLLEASQGRIFCASAGKQGGGTLWCIDSKTREVVWTQPTDLPMKLNLQGDQVFVRSKALSAFDAQTGRALWNAPVGGCGSISFSHQRIYLVESRPSARVLALDGRTGGRLWARALAASCNGIVVRGSMAFLSGNDRTLYAFLLREHS